MASFEKSSRKSTAPKRSFWTPGRVVLTLIGVSVIGALGLANCNSNEVVTSNAPANNGPANRGAITRPNPVTNAPPPDPVALPQEVRDTKLQTIDGESLKLSDYADKVLVVNIWAVWCGPCRLEMPELVKISNEYKSRGLVVLGFATSFNEDEPQVKEYVQSKNIPYKVVFDDGTMERSLVQLVNAKSVIPQSFVISRDGNIVRHFQGFNPYSTPQLMRQAIEDALNEKSKA